MIAERYPHLGLSNNRENFDEHKFIYIVIKYIYSEGMRHFLTNPFFPILCAYVVNPT